MKLHIASIVVSSMYSWLTGLLLFHPPNVLPYKSRAECESGCYGSGCYSNPVVPWFMLSPPPTSLLLLLLLTAHTKYLNITYIRVESSTPSGFSVVVVVVVVLFYRNHLLIIILAGTLAAAASCTFVFYLYEMFKCCYVFVIIPLFLIMRYFIAN